MTQEKETRPADDKAEGNVPEKAAAAAPADDRAAGDADPVRKLEAERDEFRSLAQRLRAEFENYQKRSARERDQERKYWYAPLALDLLPVLDNLERALEAARKAGDDGPLTQGVAMVQTQFLEMLRRHGIIPIEAAGKAFDPNLHQALMQQPNEELPPGTIVQVVEQGFLNQDRVLRPAKVIVSTK